MPKRKREGVRPTGVHQQHAEMDMDAECPVCLEPFPKSMLTDREVGVRSFKCNHVLCAACDGELRARDVNRCPTCRAGRKGVSEAAPATQREELTRVAMQALLERALAVVPHALIEALCDIPNHDVRSFRAISARGELAFVARGF